jgi:hypothetical protein
MAESILKYFKNSNTGQLICEQTIESDVIKNIPKYYYDIYSRNLGNYFDLTGFVEIKYKKWNLYKSRWAKNHINYSFFKNFDLKEQQKKIRIEKLKKIQNLKK